MVVAPVILVLAAGAAGAQDQGVYESLGSSSWQDHAAYETLRGKIGTAGRAQLGAIEKGLVGVVSDPNAGASGKQAACRLLWMIGSPTCVPALAKLLADPSTADMARYALEGIPGPVAGNALRAAASLADQRQLTAILGSLARRGEVASMPVLARAARSGNGPTAWAAIHGLGRMGLPAVTALRAMPATSVAAGNALLQIAQAAPGAPQAAILEALAQPARPREVRAPALAMLSVRGGIVSAKWARPCLVSLDGEVSERVASAVVGTGSPAAMSLIRATWPRMGSHARVVALTTAGVRHDAQYLPVILASLADRDADVQGAATLAASRVGGIACCNALLARLSSGGAGAGEALASMPGPGVEAALCHAAATGRVGVRTRVIAVLAERPSKVTLTALMLASGAEDAAIAIAALKGLEKCGTAAQFAGVLGVCSSASSSEVSEAAQGAVVAIAQRSDRPTAVALAVTRYDEGGVAEQKGLSGVLAELGGEAAMASLKRGVGSSDEGVRNAALVALADKWEDINGFPVLAEVAAGLPDGPDRARATRGCIRLLRDADRSAAGERVERLARVLVLASRVEDKRMALGVLRQCRVPRAAELAAGLLGIDSLAGDAAETILYLAESQKDGDRRLPAVTGPAVVAALQQVAVTSRDDGTKARALRLIP